MSVGLEMISHVFAEGTPVVLWAGGLVAAVTVWNLFGSRETPAAREQKRRRAVGAKGRVGNATILETRENTLYYDYTVAGANYTASQDITDLRGLLPEDLSSLIGPVTIKYLPTNPANSIVLCEEWSGLHFRPQQAAS